VYDARINMFLILIMRTRLQSDVRNLSLGRRHLVNAYEIKAGAALV